jgi:hypothetical protein
MSKSPSTPKEERTELPPPIEIAKVAAILSQGRNLDRKKAIDEAIAFCIQAGIRYEELIDLRLNQIVMELGDAALLDSASEITSRSKKLRLYPDKANVDVETQKQFFEGSLDAVRSYLSKKAPHLNWTKSRSVRDAIELFHLDRARRHNDKNAAAIASLERKHQKMARKVNKTVERIREGMHIGDDERRFDGRAMFDEFMAKRAEFEEGGPRVRYWELEDSFLDSLIAWRRDVKKRGGIKALTKQLKGNSSRK